MGEKEQANNSISFQERPRICLIDIHEDEFQTLKSSGFNCIKSSFGSPVDLPNKKGGDYCLCLLNYNIPLNLHEYDIIVIDLKDQASIPYIQEKHQREFVKGDSSLFFMCEHPRNVFDPRPFAAQIFQSEIGKFRNRETIIIVFSNAIYQDSYKLVELTPSRYVPRAPEGRNNYSFLPSWPRLTNKIGRETKVVKERNKEFKEFLQKYNNSFSYNIVFKHPTHWDYKNRVDIKEKNFFPLILNSDDEIVSYADFENGSVLFVFPQLEDKSDFLIDLFQSKLPAIFPNLFPYSTGFAWLEDEEYRVPNETELRLEKEKLEAEYKAKIQAIDEKISENYEAYSFLHDLLTQTGAQLVKTVENYFQWLGFEEVVNLDEVSEGPNEEDLQVSTDQGLLVVEVKGIGGTSTDNDCSQINKIKHRRAKERGTFDVFALYLVNHRRYLPPKNRPNPPFSEKQIEDAKNEERGLLTTYDLFKLYFFIESGYIAKEDARKNLLDYGLITFKPSNSVSIGQPTEIFHNHTVGIFIIKNTPIKLGGEVLISQDDDYIKAQIIGIQVDNMDVDKVSDGEIGLKFSAEITKRSEIWILNE